MMQIWAKLRNLLRALSISSRLYLIMVPATVLAILLITYVDKSIATRLLDREVEKNTGDIARQLAADFSMMDPWVSSDDQRSWLGDLAESNFYIVRIDVFRVSGDTITRIVSTSSSTVEPMSVDELSAVHQNGCLSPKIHRRGIHALGTGELSES